MERNTARELIMFKLNHIQETIVTILEKWEENNTDDFIKKARTGELEEAEMDAITIKQLLADHERLNELLSSISNEEK